MTSTSFGPQGPAIPHLSSGELADLRGDVEAGFNALEQMVEAGQVAQAALLFATQPTATNTVSIGADVYEFDGAGANINVALGVDVAATKTAFVEAINEEGTEPVLAAEDDPISAAVNLKYADAPGGTPVAGVPTSIALAETLADAGDVWNQTNLNFTGKAAGVKKMTSGSVVIDAKNLATDFHIECGFTVDHVMWSAQTAAGAPKATDCTVAPDGTGILVDANGGSTDLVATDIIKWIAWGAA